MQQILSFPHTPSPIPSTSHSCYVALSSPCIEGEELRALTPRFMLWEKGVWLLDISPCLSYWQLQGKRVRKSLAEILQAELEKLSNLGKLTDEHRGQANPEGDRMPSSPYLASMSREPWQAILLLNSLESKGFSGFFAEQSTLARNVLRSISWQSWWDCCERYVELHTSFDKQSLFQKQKRAMQGALRRLACDSPAQLQHMPSSQIRRRFGARIAELWEMSFASDRHDCSVAFPWQSFCIPEPIKISRYLDFPSSDWAVLEESLRSDLNRICFLESFKKGERILTLEWRIVLYNLQEISISILFRHPHCIRQESPHQRTALLQIFYAFQNKMREIKSLEEKALWVCSWKLLVTQTFRAPVQDTLLFGDKRQELEDILRIENQIDRPLEAYYLKNDWLPDENDELSSAESMLDAERSVLGHLGRVRPLFLLDELQIFRKHASSCLWKFRERTVDRWWKRRGEVHIRDYYQLINEGVKLWIFRDHKGQFWIQGVYG